MHEGFDLNQRLRTKGLLRHFQPSLYKAFPRNLLCKLPLPLFPCRVATVTVNLCLLLLLLRLSRQWHPDKNKSPLATQRFQELSAGVFLCGCCCCMYQFGSCCNVFEHLL